MFHQNFEGLSSSSSLKKPGTILIHSLSQSPIYPPQEASRSFSVCVLKFYNIVSWSRFVFFFLLYELIIAKSFTFIDICPSVLGSFLFFF